jgi:predicted CopG family antitoxin
MPVATVRIPEGKNNILKVIADLEKTEIKEILSELIDEYISRHKETLDLLSKPQWAETIHKGKKEVKKKIRGKTLDELEV